MAQTKLLSTNQEDGNVIYIFTVLIGSQARELKIYDLDGEDRKKGEAYANKQIKLWLKKNNGKFPGDKYLVLANGGNFSVNDIQAYLSEKKKASDLVRTNVTISAPLFEWSKAKAKKENTSFSDLVSRGLITLKDSDKEIDAWFKEQGAYFRKKLGEFGSFELFHYLPNNYQEFNTELLKDALQQAEIRRTGWPIGAYLTSSDQRPRPQQDGIKAEHTPSDYLLLDYWYAKTKGEFYFARNLDSDSGNGKAEPKTNLYFDTLIWRIAESLEHCLAYYQKLNIDANERVKVKISLYGLNGRFLGAWNSMRALTLRHYTCGSNKSSWEAEITLEELRGKLDDVIYEATKKILVMFDFFVPNKEVVLDILNREYRKSSM